MLEQAKKIILSKNLQILNYEGVSVCSVQNILAGFGITAEIIEKVLDKKSVLYLSGGSTPKELYEKLALAENLFPGSTALIDERYGGKFHAKSNELMIRGTGLLRYLQIRGIPFYPILKSGLSRQETASEYDRKLRLLQSAFPKHIAVMGIGADGHTAGIAGNRKDFSNPVFDSSRKNLLASEFIDSKSAFKERITMTFTGLSMLDFLIVLAFGKEKKEALCRLFEKGSEEEIPARFYTRPMVAAKTLIITDQKIEI